MKINTGPLSQSLARVIAAAHQPSWELLATLEPRLVDLLQRARRHPRPFDTNDVWYGGWRDQGLRGAMAELVGWSARRPIMNTSTACDIAYDKIYDSLESRANRR